MTGKMKSNADVVHKRVRTCRSKLRLHEKYEQNYHLGIQNGAFSPILVMQCFFSSLSLSFVLYISPIYPDHQRKSP